MRNGSNLFLQLIFLSMESIFIILLVSQEVYISVTTLIYIREHLYLDNNYSGGLAFTS